MNCLFAVLVHSISISLYLNVFIFIMKGGGLSYGEKILIKMSL